MTCRRWFCGVTAVLLAGAPLLATQQAGAPQPGESGKVLFQTKCVACHSLGSDRVVGPGLWGVTARRERAWLVRWIAAPTVMLSAGDSVATQLLKEYNNLPMPTLGLTEAEAAAVVAYLETRPEPGAAPATAPAALLVGDPVIGKGLFTGATRFQNAGPPCMACHSIAGIGALGGGALGPDLTPAHQKYGEAGLAAVLASIPFPTMQPIFTARPLTPQEQAHARAFLQQAVASRPTRTVAQLSLLAVAGMVVLLVPMQLFWRRRLTEVRRPMVGQLSDSSAERRG